MDYVGDFFRSYPSQAKVATLLMKNGIRVCCGKAYCGDIEQGDSALGRAAGVDRRVVRTTLERISSTPELDDIFSRLMPMLSMAELAPAIGCSTMSVVPTDARIPGILADITTSLYRAGVSVRQAVVDDSGDREKSILVIVVDGRIPPEIIPQIRSCRGVSSITIR